MNRRQVWEVDVYVGQIIGKVGGTREEKGEQCKFITIASFFKYFF